MAPEIVGRAGRAAQRPVQPGDHLRRTPAGHPPVRLGPMTEIMFAHLEGNFVFRTEVIGKHEMAVIRRRVAKEPTQRFGSCSEFVNELVKAVGMPLNLPLYKKVGETKGGLHPLPPMAPPTAPPTIPPSGFETTTGPAGATKDWAPPKPPTGKETQPFRPTPKPKVKRKTNLIGVIIALAVILGLLGLIVFITWGALTGPPTTGGAATTGGSGPFTEPTAAPPTTRPTTEKTPPTGKPPTDEPWVPPGTTRVPGEQLLSIGGGRQAPLWVGDGEGREDEPPAHPAAGRHAGVLHQRDEGE